MAEVFAPNHHSRMSPQRRRRNQDRRDPGTVLGAGIVCTALWQWSVLSRHNTIQELQDLPVHSAVHLIGVVTYVDEPGGRFWLQDETGAIPIAANPAQAGVHVGQTVSIDATKTSRATIAARVRSAWARGGSAFIPQQRMCGCRSRTR